MRLIVPEDITPPPAAGPPHVITPKSKVQLSLGTIVLICIGLFEGGRFFFSAWTAVTTKLDQHVADKARHLDEDFKRVHGEPVGKNDLDVAEVGMTKAVDDFRGQVHLEVSRAIEAGKDRRR